MFQKHASINLIGVVFSASLLLSGCLGDLFASSEAENNDGTQTYVQTNYPIWCQPRQADNPIVGCWVSPRCDYDPQDFYYTKDPTDDTTEDYWFKSVLSFVSDPGYKVLINGQLTELDGRWFFSGLWYANETCTGDAAFYSDGYIHAFFRLYGNLTTEEGLEGTVVQLMSSAFDGVTNENLRYYDLYHVTDSSNSACLYGQNTSSSETAIADDPGETVFSGLDLEHCFTFAEPGTEDWMTDKLERQDRWEQFHLYQGNNIWVNGWDNTIYRP